MKQMNAPIPEVERRRRKRFLTRRNFAYAFAIVVAILAGLNIRSEMRKPADEGFGRLYSGELKKAPVVETVAITERNVAPIDEAASADPFSLDAAAREQYLGRPTLTPEPVINPDGVFATQASVSSESAVRIVGGPEGVTLIQENRRAPVLSGGFGRE